MNRPPRNPPPAVPAESGRLRPRRAIGRMSRTPAVTEAEETGGETGVRNLVSKRKIGRGQTAPGRIGVSDLHPWEVRQLLRELATWSGLMQELADKWNMSRSTLDMYKSRHKAEIAAIQADLENQFAGMWIANKEARIAALAEMYESARSHKYANHHEWIRASESLLRSAAEELGQIPGRGSIVVIPVQHILVSIDLEELK